jgi:hypothetical protein
MSRQEAARAQLRAGPLQCARAYQYWRNTVPILEEHSTNTEGKQYQYWRNTVPILYGHSTYERSTYCTSTVRTQYQYGVQQQAGALQCARIQYKHTAVRE